MKTGLRSRIRFIDSLGFRLAALLTIALLPIGLIAVAQSWRTISESRRVSDAALLGRTAEAAAAERTLFLTTFGAAEALSDSVIALIDDTEACSALLQSFVRQSGLVAFAGFTEPDGMQRCISSGDPLDASHTIAFKRMAKDPHTFIMASEANPRVKEPNVQIRRPVLSGDRYLGYLYFAIPKRSIDLIHGYVSSETRRPAVVTFNSAGEILTSTLEPGAIQEQLPQGLDLTDATRNLDQVFRGVNNEGQDRVFAVVPVIRGQVYAIGSWGLRDEISSPRGIFTAMLYPLLMWAVSLIVAYMAVHRLVIRHVREMRGQMRRFALGQRDAAPDVLTDAPAEILEVSQTFRNLARIVIRDEDALEASLQEKTVLLKEVHHRVKNNLQLIASMMNMQIRRVKEPSARRVLKSVQNRVMSLASVHRSLYQAEQLSAARVDTLLSEILNQLLMVASDPRHQIDVRQEFSDVTLYPDQAVPLALLATEAVTNALKYMGHPSKDRPWIRVSLSEPEPGVALFVVENSVGTELVRDQEHESQAASTGLGGQLIQAFVIQLDGELLESAVEGEVYRLAVRFAIQGFTPD